MLAWIAIAYLAGTLPSPYLVAALARRSDVIAQMRRSESPGDAHFLVTRLISKPLGIASIVLDVVKGFFPALIAANSSVDASTLAWLGVAATAGHCYPPYARRSGGRGLTTAAGVSLVLIPWAMVATGIISLAGTMTKRGGFATSVGFGLLPLFAVAFGYQPAFVAMAGGLLVLIWARRLEGLGGDRAAGIGVMRAVAGRLLFDLPRGGRDEM